MAESEYTVHYADNISVGTATVTVIDNPGGTYTFNAVSASFAITPKTVNVVVTPSQTSYEYDGTAKEPAVTVMTGDEIIPASEYDVVYSDNVNAGTGKVTVIGKVSGGKKKLTVNWTAMTGVDGYQIQYGLKKSKVKTVTVANAAAAKKVVKKLKARKKYWVRICAYKNDAAGKPVCSDWSAWKSVKTK